jgi:hypothetical protein
MILTLLLAAASACAAGAARRPDPWTERPGDLKPSAVDFAWSFGTPHRLTLAVPDSSDKTLVDVDAAGLRVAWTYDDLRRFPLMAFATPATAWGLRLQWALDGKPMANTRWARAEGCLPALECHFGEPGVTVDLTGAAARDAALFRLSLSNPTSKPCVLTLTCDSQSWGENRAWIERDTPGDHLLAGWNERADRVLALVQGADAYPVAGPKTLHAEWRLKPGETRAGWIIRPYRAVAGDLPALRSRSWGPPLAAGLGRWRSLLRRVAEPLVPDAGVRQAFYACVADLFIMREPVAGGHLAVTPGTETYRAPNSGEASIVSIALDQMGLHAEALRGYRVCIEDQAPSGDWCDPFGWGHTIWGIAGFKAWAIWEHYRLTGDRAFLETAFPRLLASSRFQERQRALTRRTNGGSRPLTFGLMPRGFGDCGLKDGDDLYGTFLPPNIWAVYADRIALQAARELGRAEERELKGIFSAGREDLLEALRKGAIQESGFRWIPGVAGKTTGSRWGALNALFPTELLPAADPLITGTLRKLESRISPGGLPLNTGWMPEGMWVAIALDNLAECHLARGNGDAACGYLMASINHATPLVTWCEERGKEAGSTETAGDRQHLWTPVALVRCLRDCLVMEQGEFLHLGLGAGRDWLGDGRELGVRGAPTHFGTVTWSLRQEGSSVRGTIHLEARKHPRTLILHARAAGSGRLARVSGEGHPELAQDGQSVLWHTPPSSISFTADFER